MEDNIPQGNETILVVDDEEVLQNLAREQLESLGYQVLTAGYGLQALEILQTNNNIKLLISDVVMPGMSGYELAEQVVKQYSEMKVILVSGYTEKIIAQESQKKFMANLLTKPYSYTCLAQKVRQVLDA